MPDFTINNKRIVSYEGNEKSVTIPAGITRIGTGAFKGKNIEQIIFEDEASLKSIDDEAFADCKVLKSMLIPNGVVQIGDRAFSGCKSLLYIRVPSSVLLVGENILFGHGPDLVIIGEKGTEAEAIATEYGITLQGDEQRAIKAFQVAAKGKSSVETRSFEILGETITCSNTLAKYQEAIEYYASRKEPFFASYIELFPTDLNVRQPDVMKVFEPETDRTVDRLAKQGVLTTRDAIKNMYLLEPYKMTVDGLTAILNLQKDASETAVSNMSSMEEKLAIEADSKVTGLGYGVIGDGLDLLAYSIDDFCERQRQRNAANAEADRKFDQYKREQLNQCDKLIADTMKQWMPMLRKLSDLIIEKLLEAEIDLLTDAGIIEENATKGIDIQKSAQLIQSVIDKRDDNTFTAVLAIKKYPCNVAALTYVYEHNPSCTELKDLIQFVGMSNQVDKGLSDSKKSRLNSYITDIKNVSTASQGIDLIQKEIALFSDNEIKRMLDCVARAITPKIEAIALGEKSEVITDTKEYCTIELNSILSQSDWDFFEKYDASPVASKIITRDSITSYSLLLEWLSSKLSEMMVRKQKYDKYLEKYPLKREEEKTRAELKTVQNKISIILTNERTLLIFFGVLGVLLLIVTVICLIAISDNASLGIGVVFCVGIDFFLFRYIYKAIEKLIPLRKEEKALLTTIKEIEDLPPFIEDDKKRKDVQAKAEAEKLELEKQAEARKVQAEKAVKKRLRKVAINALVVVAIVTCIVFVIVLITVIIPTQKYNTAVELYNTGKYEEAITAFTELNGYKDSNMQIDNCKYAEAVELYNAGKYGIAIIAFTELSGYKDSKAQIEKCATAIKEEKYSVAVELYNAGKYKEAITAFTELNGYKDSLEQIDNCKYAEAVELYNVGNYVEAKTVFTALDGYKDSKEQIEKCETAIKDEKYAEAVELYNAGKYEDAISAFTALDGFKDSAEKLSEIRRSSEWLKNAPVGSIVLFGNYEQDNKTSNGKEDIEWIILAREGDRILVISRYALDSQLYNKSNKSVTWKTCSLRKWLNETFLNAAFSKSERAMIPSVFVSADNNPSYSTNPGDSTTDKVFLLSITEAHMYCFSSNSARQCQATAYCDEQGAYVNRDGFCWWWLRSPGFKSSCAAKVDFDGSVDNHGTGVDGVLVAVRPALWIKTS